MRGKFGRAAGSAFGLIVLGVLAAGCANPGPPKPPSLHLAKPVTDLAAERVGDQIRLRWTTPGETTDGVPVKGRMTAVVCRVSSLHAGPCTEAARAGVAPGASTAIWTLAGADAAGPLRPAGWRVKLLNSTGRSAGESKETMALVGAAPAAVAGLRVTVVREGVLVQWQAAPGAGRVELDRQRAATEVAKAAEAKGDKKSGGDSLGGPEREPLEVHLGAPDGGGTLDRTVKTGAGYSYVAQRVERLTDGGRELEARSVASPAVQVVVRDVFPPAVPQGLAAVAATGGGGTAIGSAVEGAIDLSWEPVTDADLAGYLVYRQAVGEAGETEGEAVRLTGSPVGVPGYHDGTVVAGKRYAYRVSAVDAAGNESARSAAVLEEIGRP